MANKYKARLGKMPSFDKKEGGDLSIKKEKPTEQIPRGHRLVFEDKSLSKETEPLDKKLHRAEKAKDALQNNVRVIYDADIDAGQEMVDDRDFKDFDDIPPINTEDKNPRQKRFGQRVPVSKDERAGQGEGLARKDTPVTPGAGLQAQDDFDLIGDAGFSSFDDIPFSDMYDSKGVPVKRRQETKEESRLFKFISTFVPVRGDGWGEGLRKIVLSLSIIVLFGTGLYLIGHFLDTEREIPPVLEETETDAEGNYIDPRDQYPDVDFPEGLLDRFVHYYAINQDFVGQIIVKGKHREAVYPVVQEKDKPQGADSFYLKHNFFKEPTRYGTPFLDHRNNEDAKDKNTILHGHNMMDGSQFAVIEDYVNDVETFKQNPIVTYWTRYEEIHYKVYAAMITNGRHKDDNGYVFAYHTPRFKDEESFLGYKRMLDMRKLYTTGVDLTYDDQLITLSTCGYVFNDAWYVLVARRLREGESLEIDESLIEVNQNPWYPQAWYDSKGMKNPYLNEVKWNG